MNTISTQTLIAPLVDSYACRRCGQILYQASEIIETRPLWDLGEEKNEVHVLRSASGMGALSRYDVSLHQGWYCCRFILMRMIVDKFGTRDHLLAYTSDVTLVKAGQAPTPEGQKRPGQLHLGAREFDEVIQRDHGDFLSIVKFGATWCPPCRLLDALIARIHTEGSLPEVRFYEADIDLEPLLGERFLVSSLPTLRFWYRGEALSLRSAKVPSVDGALIGGMQRRTLLDIASAALTAARAGQRRLSV